MTAADQHELVFLRGLLDARLTPSARQWLKASAQEIAGGASNARFCALFSLAARQAKRAPLAPDGAELEAAGRLLEGWNPERWNQLEAVRVMLVLARKDLAGDGGALALAEAFRYADEGELCALLRSLALLPGPERFLERATEGCRTNMRSVFEAAALDTPYPVRWFDDLAWRQCVIKCLFVGAPLWRLHGLDTRLSPELARMALDLADERRSAGRPVPHELWLCLGSHGGPRGLAALERELAPSNPSRAGRCAAALAFARAGGAGRLARLAASESDPILLATLARARAGETGARTFRHLEAVTA
jgi:hypothetical protein